MIAVYWSGCAPNPADSLPSWARISVGNSLSVRFAWQLHNGKVTTIASLSTTSFALTQGVLKNMALEKQTMAAWALIPAGVLALADGMMLGQDPSPRAQRNAVSVAPEEKKEVVLVD